MATGVVSDVHIGYKQSNTNEFRKFLINYNEHEIILLGDIFDLWRKSTAEVMTKNTEIIDLLLSIPKVTYIIGNHDYNIYNYYERFNKEFPFKVSKYHKLVNGKTTFYMDHGYSLDVLGNMEPMNLDEYDSFASRMCDAGEAGGYIASTLYGMYSSIQDIIHSNDKFYANKVTNLLANSSARNILLGHSYDSKYIYGHTHEAYINKNNTVANTGCWIKGTPCTYVLIEHGDMYLNTWEI